MAKTENKNGSFCFSQKTRRTYYILRKAQNLQKWVLCFDLLLLDERARESLSRQLRLSECRLSVTPSWSRVLIETQFERHVIRTNISQYSKMWSHNGPKVSALRDSLNLSGPVWVLAGVLPLWFWASQSSELTLSASVSLPPRPHNSGG